MRRLARRYARAVAQAASPGQLDAVAAALGALAEAVAAYPTLQQLLADPSLRRHRGPVLAQLLGRLQAPPLASRLLTLLERNGRLSLLGAVAEALAELADEQGGRQRVDVEAAEPLTPPQLEALGAALSRAVGRQVSLNVRVVPRLLAGCICRIGPVTLDASLHRRLEQISERLMAARAPAGA